MPTQLLGLEAAFPEKAFPQDTHVPQRHKSWFDSVPLLPSMRILPGSNPREGARYHLNLVWTWGVLPSRCMGHLSLLPRVGHTPPGLPSGPHWPLTTPLSFLHVLSFLVFGDFPLMFKLGYYSLKCIKNILSVILMCSEFRGRFWELFHLDGKTNRKSSMSALRHSKHLKYTYFKREELFLPWRVGYHKKSENAPDRVIYVQLSDLMFV